MTLVLVLGSFDTGRRVATFEPSRADLDDARRGDRLAFARLFEGFAPMVHGVLIAHGPSSEVDDLMQDVFLTALERLSSMDTERVGPWLAAIARNRMIDSLRRRARLVAMPTEEQGATDPERAEANQVLAIIRTMPDTYRETLVLKLVEGLSGKEIAEQTGLTPDSVRVNLHRGMRMLRERLGLSPEGDLDE
ncbi:MAG: sigma-70 family RNA polymerase sigma factor [Archangiaceae bacterium]|nr:sigma-70 family RNA polymerase sigma factor [Archangiaceae bacterium]